jgi:hypothetical protein
MRRFANATITAAGAVAVLATAPGAGVLDSPPPEFAGHGRGTVVFRMGPVHYDPGAVDTVVTCTSLSERSLPLAFEVFDEHGTRSGAVTRADLAPGASVSFVTSIAAEVVGGVTVSDLAPIEHGKARVSAPSGAITCVGVHRIVAADGPTAEIPLELVKRVAPR